MKGLLVTIDGYSIALRNLIAVDLITISRGAFYPSRGATTLVVEALAVTKSIESSDGQQFGVCSHVALMKCRREVITVRSAPLND